MKKVYSGRHAEYPKLHACQHVDCQHFQTTSPLKPLGQLGPNFIRGMLGLGGGGLKVMFLLNENWLFSLVAVAT